MSFLKNIAFKQKIHLITDFFYDFVLIKRSIYALGISLLFSFYVLQTSTLQFEISATLKEAGFASEDQNILGSSAAQALLGGSGGGGSDGSFNDFKSNMHSYAMAQRMWRQGWGSKIYGNGDLNAEYFNAIPKNHQTSSKIAAFVLGYDLFEFYSAHDLQAYIIRSFKVSKKRGSSNITVSALKSNKDFTITFMNAVILEADKYAKETLIKKSNEVIASTYKQLATSKNSSISSALGNTINSEYYKIGRLENDMPFHIDIIDPPHSSEYPVQPNIAAIIYSNLIIFLVFSVLLSFVQKHKEDLW
ncbi:hypothetical protein N8317_05320 [Gammaproteobacteria bacterium]|nr:hypothetical protein [Gammaproteobacteria bacterium]